MSTEQAPAQAHPELDPSWPAGHRCIILDQTDSTMAEARRRASELSGPTWILAHQQTAAHGRRGRAWENPRGNFAATLFMRPDGSPQDAALRSFTAACALFQTLAQTTPPENLSLKWPNDVLLKGAKVAGILLESAGRGMQVDWLSIGIGVNLVTAPPSSSLEARAMDATSLKQATGHSVPAEEFLVSLAGQFASLEAHFSDYGFAPIRALWLRHAARLGSEITARTAQEELRGTFETVDENGNLVLSTANGRRAIPAADVYF